MVDFNTPGFKGRNLIALVNTTGKNAPKTNVARSNMEITPEKEVLLTTIYELYLEHVSNEIQNLIQVGFSISWAANEASWLLSSFTNGGTVYSHERDVELEDVNSFEKALSKVKCILIERDGKRQIISINDLKKLNHYWTIDSASYSSADSLIKEIKSSNTSALSLMKTIFGSEDSNTDHVDYLLCNSQSQEAITEIIENQFQVDAIKIIYEQRRLDLRWKLKSEKIWEEIRTFDEYTPMSTKCLIQLSDIEMGDSITQTAIKTFNFLFILKKTELNKYLINSIQKLSKKTREERIALSHLAAIINMLFHYKDLDVSTIEEVIDNRVNRQGSRNINEVIWSLFDKQEFINAVLKTDFIKYDTTIWDRRGYY